MTIKSRDVMVCRKTTLTYLLVECGGIETYRLIFDITSKTKRDFVRTSLKVDCHFNSSRDGDFSPNKCKEDNLYDVIHIDHSFMS